MPVRILVLGLVLDDMYVRLYPYYELGVSQRLLQVVVAWATFSPC